MKMRIQSSSAASSIPPDDLQSQPSTSTNPNANYIQPLMKRSGLDTNSLAASLWTSSMVSADSNTPSDLAFYRRASWLEEYALHRLRSIEDRSEAKKQQAVENRRSAFGSFLTSCLPCTKKSVQPRLKKRSIAFSSQTSLTSMLEKAEEDEQRMAQVRGMNGQELTRRPQQRLVMITTSL
ncbi:hypothetical protein M3Y97_00599800 [Aphelenchoides bicaudatus]|nr:hypothetical protein M3Y97_00599800 [Aphelenchoides bicaudatus]